MTNLKLIDYLKFEYYWTKFLFFFKKKIIYLNKSGVNAKQGVDGRLMAPYAMESDGTITLEKSVLLLFRK